MVADNNHDASTADAKKDAKHTGGVVTLVVDTLLFPASYVPKLFTGGQTLGDMLSGTERPPSKNGFAGNLGAFTVDVITFPVSVITRAFTGNSVGDYALGDTNEKRQKIVDERNAQLEAAMPRVREEQAGRAPEMAQAVQQEVPQKSFVADEMSRRSQQAQQQENVR